jgi:hypothetical protein
LGEKREREKGERRERERFIRGFSVFTPARFVLRPPTPPHPTHTKTTFSCFSFISMLERKREKNDNIQMNKTKERETK